MVRTSCFMMTDTHDDTSVCVCVVRVCVASRVVSSRPHAPQLREVTVAVMSALLLLLEDALEARGGAAGGASGSVRLGSVRSRGVWFWRGVEARCGAREREGEVVRFGSVRFGPAATWFCFGGFERRWRFERRWSPPWSPPLSHLERAEVRRGPARLETPSRTSAERNGTDRIGTERNGTERNGTDRNGTERIGSERIGSERNGTERNGTDRNGTDRIGSDRIGTT